MDCTQTVYPSFFCHISNQVFKRQSPVQLEFVGGQCTYFLSGIRVGCISEQLSAPRRMEFTVFVVILSGLASGSHLDILRACLLVSGKAPFFPRYEQVGTMPP
jgi:hypothetical protein